MSEFYKIEIGNLTETEFNFKDLITINNISKNSLQINYIYFSVSYSDRRWDDEEFLSLRSFHK